MEDNRSQIRSIFTKAIGAVSQKIGISLSADLPFEIETPKNKKFGDYAVNIALAASAASGKNPRELAEIFKNCIEQGAPSKAQSLIRKLEVAGPGFINIFLTEVSRGDILQVIQSQKEKFGHSNDGKNEKIILEFVSANPTGPLTIAHGRQAAVGDTLANILNAVGYQVHKEFYLNDSGRQIDLLGRSVWVRYQQLWQKEEGKSPEKIEVGDSEIEPAFPEDSYRGDYVIKLAEEFRKKVGNKYYKQQEGYEKFSEFAVVKMLDAIKNDLKSINVVFDEYYSEKSLHEKGLIQSALDALTAHGYLYESEGALWFKSTQFGDDKDRVLKRQTGDYTYFVADIAYHEDKFKRGFNRIINLWGPDHHGYISRVKAACQALGHASDKIKILIVQLTTLYKKGEVVRMSKRAGEFVTLRDLIEEAGQDAARFFFLMRRVESHLDFDLELAKEKSQDNPVYYLQYAHARISSMLKLAGRRVSQTVDTSRLQTPEEIEILKKLAEYPEVLKQAADSLEPYRLVDYLRELAALFHKFYAVCRVINDQDESLTSARLLLTDSVRIVLRNGLKILGISQPQKM